jgi:hypothetical protein
MWQSKLPLKVKNFVWLVIKNRIEIVDNLGKKNGRGVVYANYVRKKKI